MSPNIARVQRIDQPIEVIKRAEERIDIGVIRDIVAENRALAIGIPETARPHRRAKQDNLPEKESPEGRRARRHPNPQTTAS
jgi:hypothetical protein